MANSIYQKLGFAIAGTVLSLTVIEAHSANAAIITYDFNVNITSGPLLGNQYSGFFSYDDTSPAPFGLQPFFGLTEYNFDFPERTGTPSNLFLDCRVGPSCLPLEITGGEVVFDEPNGKIYLIPRGGELVRFAFSTFNPFRPPFPGFFTLIGGQTGLGFTYQLPFNPGEPPSPIGGGSGTVSRRPITPPPPTSVPEPGTVFGLSMLGFGWLLGKKKVSSHG